MTENKFTKYLLYAIGEIILVVVGILIAVQINQAITLKEKSKRKMDYVHSMIEEIQSDTTAIKRMIGYSQSELDKLDTLKSDLAEMSIQLKDLPNIDFTRNLSTLSNFNNTSFVAMLNAGDLELFTGEERSALVKFNALQERYIKANDLSTLVLYETLNRHVINVGFGGILPDKLYAEYVDENYFKKYASTMNALTLQRRFLLNVYMTRYHNLMDESVKMLNLLESLKE
ncbi:MAG: hypothetical protein JJ895_03995 [Balneolaceae bacterium]|nr:hypothetical protein [Balneolaceae bacterium]